MVDGTLFDKLDAIASVIRSDETPFGGIQVRRSCRTRTVVNFSVLLFKVVATGDFFQLPPVVDDGAIFAFDAVAWDQVIQETYILSRVFRQRDPGTRSSVDMYNSN